MGGTGPLTSVWTQAGGLRLHALASTRPPRYPAAPPVVLVHGVAVSSRAVSPAAAALAPHVRVYAPDLPGHGRSDDPGRVLGLSDLAGWLLAWVGAAGLGRVSLLGNSFGCQLAVEAALRHPERVDRAVLQGPTHDPAARGWGRQLARWLRNARMEGATQPGIALRDWQDAGLKRLVLTALYSLRDPVERKLPHVHVPVLVVRGARDPIVPQRWAEEVTRLLPCAALAVLPGLTHTIVSTHPEEMARAVLGFLTHPEPQRWCQERRQVPPTA